MNIEKTLQKYGLNEKQAKIYLACLELENASVQQISVKSGLARATVYEILRSLQATGLISSYQKKKAMRFTASDPRQILKLEEEKLNSFQDILPELNARYAKSKSQPTVRLYLGQEQMKIIFKEIIDEADMLLSFGSAEDLFGTIGHFFYKFVKERIKKRIPVKVILKDSPKARERQRLGPAELREVKIVPNNYECKGNIWIWKNKMAMLSFTNDFTAVVIDSKELTDIQRAQFNSLWDKII